MSLDEYRLSGELLGHSLDVRSVAVADSFIVSGSRDKTAKIWERHEATYIDQYTLTNHTNFVSSVCVLEGGKYICTGSNDATICVYMYGSSEPFTVLKGHESTVSCLAAGAETNLLLSGSWDKSVIAWQISTGSVAQKFIAHEAAVWAVTTLKSGTIVTGSADKTIIYWNRNGERLKVLKAHHDCVRSIVALPNDMIISAGNDAVIKLWSEDGECLREMHGHTNFIYSLALNTFLGEDVLLSCGEDSTLRMWNATGQLGQEITLPAESVWCVACDPKNGDIIAATSDGIVRVFTKDSTRFADEKVLADFQMAVEVRIREKNASLGGVKVNELPGPEALLHKGRDGQTKMIRYPNGKIMCHEWANGKWNEIGDVIGAAGGTQETSGKTLYNGKEYDFVFSVDVSETEPPLKLPYNRNQDPWVVAQQFIHQNDLPQSYLEQVVDFIIKNSGGAPAANPTSSSYQDPFTGAARYVPGSNDAFTSSGGNVDPFTGGSSYTTSSNPTVPVNFVPRSGQNLDPLTGGSSHTSGVKERQKHFPFTNYIIIDTCDAIKVLAKLREFNGVVDSSLKITDAELEDAIKFAQGSFDSNEAAEALKKLLLWPKENLFPVLDILRMAVRDGNACTKLITPETLILIVHNSGCTPANQLMSLRCLSNMLIHSMGRDLIDTFLPNVLVSITTTQSGSANLQIAIATLLLSLTIVQLTKADQTQCQQITESIIDFLLWSTDLEALYRCYQSIGNLLSTPHNQIISAQIVSTDQIMDALRAHANNPKAGAERISEIADDIMKAL